MVLTKRSLFCSVLALCSIASSAAAVTNYALTDLGVLPGGGDSYAYGVNNAGQATGSSTVPDATISMFFWSGGTMTNVTPGLRSSGGGISNPTGERPAYVVGGINRQNIHRAFYWSEEGGLVEFGPSEGWSSANSANDQGEIVGYMKDPDTGEYLGFRYSLGQTVVSLDPGHAYDINNDGIAVGVSEDRACLWNGTTRTFLAGLGVESSSQARAINDLGQIVGQEDSVPFLWESGSVTYLPMLVDDGQPFDINSNGVIVGRSEGHACLWENGVIYDLNDLLLGGAHWTLDLASGINDTGRIVCTAEYSYGGNVYDRAVLLTPVPIPEPATIGLVGCALAALALRVGKT